jgi:hypothetical protein
MLRGGSERSHDGKGCPLWANSGQRASAKNQACRKEKSRASSRLPAVQRLQQAHILVGRIDSGLMAETVAPRKRTSVSIGLGRLLAKLYAAIDRSQRKRADRIIQRYSHLLPDPDEHNNILEKYVTRTSQSNRVDRIPTNRGCSYREAMPLSPRVASHSKTRRTLW